MFQQGNKLAVGGRKEKPFRDALMMAIKEAEANANSHRALRRVAERLLDEAAAGNVQALKEVADRLDGKVPQGIIGGDDEDPAVKVQAAVTMTIVDPRSS
jgi:hypothetical protein